MTKFSNIPDGGGRRQAAGGRRQAAGGERRSAQHRPATARQTRRRVSAGDSIVSTEFVHTVIDDHSRVAHAETHPVEKAVAATGVLKWAVF